MNTYILLLTLTPEGREKTLRDPENIHRAAIAAETSECQVLGQYAVLGSFDFVCIVEAEHNEAVAHYSLRLGVAAGAQVASFPVIPIARIAETSSEEEFLESSGRGEPAEPR